MVKLIGKATLSKPFFIATGVIYWLEKKRRLSIYTLHYQLKFKSAIK